MTTKKCGKSCVCDECAKKQRRKRIKKKVKKVEPPKVLMPSYAPEYSPQMIHELVNYNTYIHELGKKRFQEMDKQTKKPKLTMQQAFSLNIPSTISVEQNKLSPLPMDESIPIGEPIKKKIQIIRPLPMNESIPIGEPIKKKIEIKRTPPVPSEYTPSIFTVGEESIPLLKPSDIKKDVAFSIIAKYENKAIKTVKNEYNKMRKENPTGALAILRQKAYNYQQQERFNQL